MIDLYSARDSYWKNDKKLLTYQQIWTEIRKLLAHNYQQVLNGVELPDNTLTISHGGTPVARFEIK